MAAPSFATFAGASPFIATRPIRVATSAIWASRIPMRVSSCVPTRMPLGFTEDVSHGRRFLFVMMFAFSRSRETFAPPPPALRGHVDRQRVALREAVLLRQHFEAPFVQGLPEGLRVPHNLPRVVPPA